MDKLPYPMLRGAAEETKNRFKESQREINSAETREVDLNQRLIAVLEAERVKIAREIHDEAGQLLISVAFRLDQSLALLPRAFVARELVEQAREMVDQCAEALHELALNLRPRMLDDLGLIPALRNYLKRYVNLSSVEMDITLEQPPRSLNPATELAIFRIVQESIANIRKHAKATAVRVHLGFTEDSAQLEISDNGVGFDPGAMAPLPQTRPKLGLLGMEERAIALRGKLEVESARFSGTTIRAIIPIGGNTDDRPE